MNSHLTEEFVTAQQTSFGREKITECTKLSIREAGELVRRKAISPVDLTRASLQRVERLNPTLNAFITVTVEQAIAHIARSLDHWMITSLQTQ